MTLAGEARHGPLWSNTAMAEPGDETRTLPPQPPAPQPSRPGRPRGLGGTIWVLEHAQDYVAGVVGIALILLAAVLIVSGLIGFVHDLITRNVLVAATGLLDRLLLVLIVAEIVHTVVLSLRAHRLVAQPFIVVGLVAVIRKILLVLSSQTSPDTTQLWLLIAMVVAFVAGLIAVSRFEKKEE
jgi:uncharacterized membrane protein (DUF373 family)